MTTYKLKLFNEIAEDVKNNPDDWKMVVESAYGNSVKITHKTKNITIAFQPMRAEKDRYNIICDINKYIKSALSRSDEYYYECKKLFDEAYDIKQPENAIAKPKTALVCFSYLQSLSFNNL